MLICTFLNRFPICEKLHNPMPCNIMDWQVPIWKFSCRSMAKDFPKTTWKQHPLKQGSTLRVRSSASACWLNCLSTEGKAMQKLTRTSDILLKRQSVHF